MAAVGQSHGAETLGIVFIVNTRHSKAQRSKALLWDKDQRQRWQTLSKLLLGANGNMRWDFLNPPQGLSLYKSCLSLIIISYISYISRFNLIARTLIS